MIVETRCAQFDSLALEGGATLTPVEVAYETYGELNADRSNAILITHAFSGDAHAAGISHETGKPGWWDNMIGPGKAFDTDRYFVICSNALGGCQGTTGPGSINPATGAPYAMSFPVITIRDMVHLQKMLVDWLGIQRLLCVAGGSMGGMQALEWAVSYPEFVRCAIPIATTWRHSAQQIAFNEVGRQAIMADPDWCDGDYYDKKPPGARTVGGAHGRPHHVHERRIDAREVRPPAAPEGEIRIRFRRGFRSGELSALPRQSVRFALRRQLVSLHHQGRGLLRSDQRHGTAGRSVSIASTRASS